MTKDCRFSSEDYKNLRQGLGRRHNSSREQVRKVSYHHNHNESRNNNYSTSTAHLPIDLCLPVLWNHLKEKDSSRHSTEILKSHVLFWYSRKKMLLIISLQSLNHEGKERPGPTFWFCILDFGEYWHFFSSVKMRSQLKIKVLKMNKTSEGFCGAYPVSTQTAKNITLLSLTLLNLERYNSVALSSWYRTLSQHAKSQSYCQWIPPEVFHCWGSKTRSGRRYFSRPKWRCDHSSSL